VNICHSLGWTALQVAAVNGNEEAVEDILKAEADSDFSDEFINAHRTGFEIGLHATDIIRQQYEFSDLLSKRASFHGLAAQY
jgi:ATP-dependent Clp protease ATP-binding subunit ClpB